jgi:hypothetical protein
MDLDLDVELDLEEGDKNLLRKVLVILESMLDSRFEKR